jgi:hypothetical protein
VAALETAWRFESSSGHHLSLANIRKQYFNPSGLIFIPLNIHLLLRHDFRSRLGARAADTPAIPLLWCCLGISISLSAVGNVVL